MRAFDRDLIRGGNYGQRSREPHKQAEHMAAPTNAAKCRFSLPTRSRPHSTIMTLWEERTLTRYSVSLPDASPASLTPRWADRNSSRLI